MKKILILLILSFISMSSLAQKRQIVVREKTSFDSMITYDVSGSSGTYNNSSYTEMTLGVNWLLADWLNWRNAAFSRFGTNVTSSSGLDSSLRLSTSMSTEGGGFGMDAFVGPGLRLATANSNAVFGEAGVIFRLGGLRIGGGVKSLYYINNQTDSTGASLPKSDNQFFIELSGGGRL